MTATDITAPTMIAWSEPSPSSPAPAARRFAVAGLDRSVRPSKVVVHAVDATFFLRRKPQLQPSQKSLTQNFGHSLLREFKILDKQIAKMARLHARAKLLMTTPAVGPVVSLTYASAIDDPKRFRSSKMVGPHFGLTPKKYQSGETDVSGRISKVGDASVREALYQAAHIMLTKPVKNCTALKSWAMRIAKRAGMRKAKVALARRLAVIMHRMLADGLPFNPNGRTAAVAAAA